MSNEEQIQLAIAHLNRLEKPNLTAVAKKFGLNRSTLSKRYKGISVSKQQSISETRQRLNEVQEDEILRHIDALTNKFIPPTTQIVKNLAEEILHAEVGKNWPARFVKRHQDRLCRVYLRPIDNKRASAENPATFKHFYSLVRSVFAI